MPVEPPARLLSVHHRPWATPLRRPRMSNHEDVRPGVALTSRALLRDGVPVVPVSGELHYSRVPRHRWRQRLRQMRAGGVTTVATYAFWLHHVEDRDAPRFDGNLDVAAFLDLCAAERFDVILRIGPWCHGETRNGGFPDWVQQAPVRHRTDDPGYLALVREWFGQLGRQVGGRPVLGIQLENELYDQPDHLVTLKRLAREAGMSAPLWTATAWGSAELPAEEVLPLYGGYGDGFWVDAAAPWDPTFRAHYFFSHVWDDPGIGADLRRSAPSRSRPPSPLFPPATAELGGGMATAYHRRPRPSALDIATVAHCKIGNGSAWQGYYMYAGGTNPPGRRGTQESHATGYPNDLPPRGYDFHAPIGEAGVLAPSHALLRQQHAFLAAFGPSLAGMPSSLPAAPPAGIDDTRTLRWALRSDGTGGFLFLAWHQPHVPLPLVRGARFEVVLDGGSVVLPSRPVDVPAGTLACWPLRLTLGGVRLDWITASALTVLPGSASGPGSASSPAPESGTGPVPTLVLIAAPDVPVEYAVGGVAHPVTPSREPVRVGGLDLLVLPAADAPLVWVCEDGPAGRRLLLSSSELSWGPSGRITSTGADVLAYDPASRRFTPLALVPVDSEGPEDGENPEDSEVPGGNDVPVDSEVPAGRGGAVDGRPVHGGAVDDRVAVGAPVDGRAVDGRAVDGRAVDGGPVDGGPVDEGVVDGGAKLSESPAGIIPHPVTGWATVAVERAADRAVPVSYGKFDGRESAPAPDVFDELAAVYRLELPAWAADPALDALLHIGWAGDVGRLRVDGRTVTDRFWDGSEWIVNLRDAGYRAGSRVSLHLLPLAAGSPVWLPAEARERLLGSDGQLLALDRVRVVGRHRWREQVSPKP